MIPLLLNLRDKKVTIFGGGSVGERKARLFSKHAEVTVISKEFTRGLEDLAEEGIIKTKKAEIDEDVIESFIKDAFIVIPATDDERINSKIIERAKIHKKLLNRVDDEIGDIVVPSIVEKGDIIVSISTGGKSPAMSKFLRKKIEEEITDVYSRMVKLQKDMKRVLKREVEDQKEREKILWEILENEKIWEKLERSYEDALKAALGLIPRSRTRD
ncbi:MAG: precorrin-2 dehydrogenase/sirohydrochlorin ferrochelatase family protein [Candidatus Syntropharchaeia archaeon]